MPLDARPALSFSLLAAAASLLVLLPGCKSKERRDAEEAATGIGSFSRAERCLAVCAKSPQSSDTEPACSALKRDIGDLCMSPWSEAHPATPAYLGGKADFKRWNQAQTQCFDLCRKVDATKAFQSYDEVQRDCDQVRRSSW
jgi:hypothetical protein